MSDGKSHDWSPTNLRRLIIGAVRARLSGAERFGKRQHIIGRVKFSLEGRAVFGDVFIADGSLATVSIGTRKGGNLSIGDHVFINSGVTIDAWHDVRIGNHVLLAPSVYIVDCDQHEVEPGSALRKEQVIVGDNVWLGRNAAVMPGVSIGSGSVIGANSVVTKDIPPNSFAAGVPARVIRKLEIPDGWIRR
jgi:acetyltransferase-like isoleucine patch superfamily enzyme